MCITDAVRLELKRRRHPPDPVHSFLQLDSTAQNRINKSRQKRLARHHHHHHHPRSRSLSPPQPPPLSTKVISVLNTVSSFHRFAANVERRQQTERAEVGSGSESESAVSAAVGVSLGSGWADLGAGIGTYTPNTLNVAANNLETLRNLYRTATGRGGVAKPSPVTPAAPGPLTLICGAPVPAGDTYKTLDGWNYVLDDRHRVIRACSPGAIDKLPASGETRDHHMSQFVRFLAYPLDDDAGHIVAKQLGGSVDPLTLVPQAILTNRVRRRNVLWCVSVLLAFSPLTIWYEMI